MWMLKNRTPYAADKNWIRDKRGMHHWLVALKATFDVSAHGRVALADEQPPPALAPEYRGDPGSSSLRFDSDLLARKPTTDILVDAAAHAPRGNPAATVPVLLRVDRLEKALLVHGPRVYYQGATGPTTSAPRPFVTRPIEYEAAFGGTDLSHPNPQQHRIDARNPVGKGFAVDFKTVENQPAHSVEYPRGNPEKVGPAGYGPLAAFWSPRRERMGTYDAAWEKQKRPLLPDDYDERAGLSAPDDQRPAQPLRGGEMVLLENLTPEGRLVFQLPIIIPTFVTHVNGREEEHPATLTTVFVAAEKKQVSLTWQGSLPIHSRELEYLDLTEIGEK
ncbi:MAG TPA: DUF2169 domain-containing protein [Polyangia bacterium]